MAKNSSNHLWLGTSGYSYKEWKGSFYPQTLPANRYLDHYVGFFNSVEINSSFYHFPQAATMERFRDRAPEGFVYSVKAWKMITHYRRLANCEKEVNEFVERAALLGKSLGPILFQLPGSLKADLPKLENFLKMLSKGFRYVMEFRDQSWLQEKVYDLLNHHQVAICRVNSPDMDGPKKVFTAPFAYWRLHGKTKWYYGHYSPADLKGYAEEIKTAITQKKDAYFYFDNTAGGDALDDARNLKEMMGSSMAFLPD